MLDNFIHGDWGNKFENLSTVFSVTSLGAIVMGTFFGLIREYRLSNRREPNRSQLCASPREADT